MTCIWKRAFENDELNDSHYKENCRNCDGNDLICDGYLIDTTQIRVISIYGMKIKEIRQESPLLKIIRNTP